MPSMVTSDRPSNLHVLRGVVRTGGNIHKAQQDGKRQRQEALEGVAREMSSLTPLADAASLQGAGMTPNPAN